MVLSIRQVAPAAICICIVSAAIALGAGNARAKDIRNKQVLIETKFLEIGLGASSARGDLTVDFNNPGFDSETQSLSKTRGYLALGFEALGPRFGTVGTVIGAKSQIFFQPEVFDINFDLPQLGGATVNAVGRNIFNITPFVGLDFGLGDSTASVLSQPRLRIFAGPTFADQKLTVDIDNFGNRDQYSKSNLTVSPTIGLEVLTTSVNIPKGTTVLLGGLDVAVKASTQVTFPQGVPSLSDIPALGAAFRQHRDPEVSAELLIVLTPRILNPPD